MSNKVLKDANNQLINIDSSNLSSFSEGVVHTTGTETITGDKKIQDAALQFEFTDSIYQGYPINGSIRAGYLSQNSHDWPGLQFSYQDDYADSQAESYFTGVLSSYYTENNERLPALVWSTNYLDPDSGDYDDNFYVYHLPKGGTVASPKTLATTDDLTGKVSKIGDTMTGDLTLNIGSGYSLSPKLVFVNQSGNAYLHKDGISLKLNHTGSPSYTLTFPTTTGTVTTKETQGYTFQITAMYQNVTDANVPLQLTFKIYQSNGTVTTVSKELQRGISQTMGAYDSVTAVSIGWYVADSYTTWGGAGGSLFNNKIAVIKHPKSNQLGINSIPNALAYGLQESSNGTLDFILFNDVVGGFDLEQ